MPRAPAGRSLVVASARARAATASSKREEGASSSTRPHSRARAPRIPSSVVEKTSARSRRTLRLSTTRTSPPVPAARRAAAPPAATPRSRRRRRGGSSRRRSPARSRPPAEVPVDRAEIALARMRARVLDRTAGLVGELAECDLVGVARRTEHADVRAGAEHPLPVRADHHRRHLGVLEAQPLHRVGQLDVHAEIVGVELQLVAGREAARLVDVEREGGDAALDAQGASGGCSAPVRCARRSARFRARGGSAVRRSTVGSAMRPAPYVRWFLWRCRAWLPGRGGKKSGAFDATTVPGFRAGQGRKRP